MIKHALAVLAAAILVGGVGCQGEAPKPEATRADAPPEGARADAPKPEAPKAEVPKPGANTEAQTRLDREDEFRHKQACLDVGLKFARELKANGGPEGGVIEVFYSPVRNSCVCETSDPVMDADELVLVDCLTNERISQTVIGPSHNPSAARSAAVEAWKREKDALKAPRAQLSKLNTVEK